LPLLACDLQHHLAGMIERFLCQFDTAEHACYLQNTFFLVKQGDPGPAATPVVPLLHAQMAVGLGRDLRKMRDAEYLALFAELWRDREMAAIAATRPAVPAAKGRSPRPLRLAEGARVQHERFGPGVVQSIDPDGGDPKVTILFDNGEQRTFLASLVSDKLQAL
jgi:hypothetical protein